MITMGLHNKVCIGHVETVNLEGTEQSMIERKVVALRFVGTNKVTKLPMYQPLRNYMEYYNIKKVEPLKGFVSDAKINRALNNTGKKEVKRLQKIK